MTAGLRERLEQDVEKARDIVHNIQRNPGTNYLVVEQDFLNPKRISRTVDDHHPEGSLMYFVGVQMALESALNCGYIPREYVNGIIGRFHPPKYLQPLIEKTPRNAF